MPKNEDMRRLQEETLILITVAQLHDFAKQEIAWAREGWNYYGFRKRLQKFLLEHSDRTEEEIAQLTSLPARSLADIRNRKKH